MEFIAEKTLWQGTFIKASLIYYRDRKGLRREWEAVGRRNCDGVVIIIPVTIDKEVLLIRQYRPVLKNYVIELPAGLIDDGEDLNSAAKRELIEETAHASDDLVLLTDGVMSTGIDTDKWNIVLARDVKAVSEEIRKKNPPDESEDIETIHVPLDAVYEKLECFRKDGDDVDLRIYGFLELAKRKFCIS